MILETCQARKDIVEGSFNPEIFTASLSQVMDAYRGKEAATNSIYTDGLQFFRDATYPTEGLKMILGDVFARLSGDNSAPAIHRLETAFGGGKTHGLISLAHLGFRGQELADVTDGIIDQSLLPAPEEITVVGIAGEEIPVHKPKGTTLVPYTLWGEIAYQIGGEKLYRDVESDAVSYAAPGKNFLEAVFEKRKVLIMLDELAQYAARLEAARPNGADQLAAFLLALHGYARNRQGIAVVLTLAGQADAFSLQTMRLTKLISKVRGEEISEQEALGMTERAEKSVRSVVARDAVTVVPVHGAEISRVLAKRLFEQTDRRAAEETSHAYMEMYRRNSSLLPDRANREDFRNSIAAHYPFHPTFIEFLTRKLSTVETFQGTRGVLRVLALTIRSLWQKKKGVPMIHTCHIDLRDTRTVNEILGRTGGSDLLPVLNTDVGGADTSSLAAGSSFAEQADQRNPHPARYPLYEYTWKTVFLHSLVGRTEGLRSNIFGITERDALFEISFPEMTPPQVETALREIDNSGQYLRSDQGRYYASLDPHENRALAGIRRTLSREQVQDLLDATARKVVTAEAVSFRVEHDVSQPEHIEDKPGQPALALIALDADEIDAEAFVTTAGPNRPRQYQNLVFLLVPEIVHGKGEVWKEDKVIRTNETKNRLEELARDVLARRRLREQPENYGIPAARLSERFRNQTKEREQALVTAVTQAYSRVYFPSASGQVVYKEIKTGGGEGGVSVAEEIRRVLRQEGELITSELGVTLEGVQNLSKLLFEPEQTPSLGTVRQNFFCNRRWPVLEQPNILDQIVRAGVTRNVWCLFRMGSAENVKPEEIYCRESGEPPFHLNLADPGWCLVTVQGANKRGWVGPSKVDPVKLERYVTDVASKHQANHISELVKNVYDTYGEVPERDVLEAVDRVVQSDRIVSFPGRPEQQEKPAHMVHGASAILHHVKSSDAFVTKAEAAKRGWIEAQPNRFILEGAAGAEKFVPLLGRLGSLYSRGATSKIEALDMSDLAVGGGAKLRLSLESVSPDEMKRLGELFEVLATVVRKDPSTEVYLEIHDPDDECLLIKELKKEKEQ
jgi:hypothetical protein